MQVKKRNGVVVDFDRGRVKAAIEAAMRETYKGVDSELSSFISARVEEVFSERGIVLVEDVQDEVEEQLMSTDRQDVAKKYLLYRAEKSRKRNSVGAKQKKLLLLSDEFISKYKHLPTPMSPLGQFVYYRTYSRYLEDEMRREYWYETVRRSVEYNCSLARGTTVKEAEELFDNIFHLRQFLSGRTFWVGGTEIAKTYPMSNFNCAFQVVDSFSAFEDLFYLLMLGSGVGLRILKEDANKLPKIRTGVVITHEGFNPKEPSERREYSTLTFPFQSLALISVGDSKEGWMQALRYFFEIFYRHDYNKITDLVINYDNVRSKGERLKRFGGTASGHESLMQMFRKISLVFQGVKGQTSEPYVKLRPIDCLDISNIIGENVVSGGVRRSSEMVLIDSDDMLCINAKNNLYTEKDGKWEIDKSIAHRQMSNNSIFYKSKPARETLHWQIGKMRFSGEPAWINGEALERKGLNRKGVNPCGEILLDSREMCNLTTVNAKAFVDSEGVLDVEKFKEAQRLSARAAFRMTCVEMELHEWNATLQRDKILGCSMTGWQDMVNLVGLSEEDEDALKALLKKVAKEEAKKYADELGEVAPILVTTIKPEGTLSQLPGVSSGVHYSHSPYFIRRVRISAEDPLVKVCEKLGYPVLPEVGQDIETCRTKVVEFPVKAPNGRTKYDVSAIEQLENYKSFMADYVDHNCSITVHVRNEEWEEVEQWVWDHWDDIVGVTFISLDDAFYELMPYQKISKEEYEKRVLEMHDFIPSMISEFENFKELEETVDSECSSGVCPIR